ncbi:MAG TPA: hypothetical protein DHR60_06270 [Bacteroides uniformis]|nr:hypothetical protein [Bacteroides uniformis]
MQQFPVRVRAYSHKSIIMKVEIPDYFLKSFIRHFERITENCKASPSDIKTSEALRLGKKDIVKLKRFVNKKYNL